MAWACKNGVIVPVEALTISYADIGFAEGASVTDFARTYDGRLFYWDAHCERFEADCQALGINLPESRAKQTNLAEELLARNHPGGEAAALIRFATPGLSERLLPPDPDRPCTRPTLGMHTVPLPPTRYAHVHDGARLQLAGLLPGSGIVPVQVKHRSRLAWRLAQQAVPSGTVAVLCDETGAPDSALGAVLAVRGKQLIRAPRGRVLESVSFQVLADFCNELGFDFIEASFDVRDETNWEALLLAGSGFGFASVAEWHEKRQPPHPTVAALVQAFRQSYPT